MKPKKIRILVVDDEPDFVFMIKRILELNGYLVLTAEDGSEGLKKTLKEKPDLILLDIMMPKKDGFKMLSEIKSDEEMAQEFRDLDIKALLIGWDSQAESGYDTSDTNDEVAKYLKKFPDVFIGGWAMIDPWKGKWAVKELERCV